MKCLIRSPTSATRNPKPYTKCQTWGLGLGVLGCSKGVSGMSKPAGPAAPHQNTKQRPALSGESEVGAAGDFAGVGRSTSEVVPYEREAQSLGLRPRT